jgi:hypothetical protein
MLQILALPALALFAEAGPILPGNAYEFEITASAGELLTLAFMFGQSNDLFYTPHVSRASEVTRVTLKPAAM